MGAIPLPLPSTTTTTATHLILRRLLRPFPLSNRPISLLSTTSPPHLLPLHTSTPPFFTPPFLPFSTTPFLPHSLPTSQSLQTDASECNIVKFDEDKVVDFDEDNSDEDNVDFDANEVVDFDKDKVVDSDEDNVDFDENEVVDLDEDGEEKGGNDLKTNILMVNAKPAPSLSIKEKKELASYAHSLGKKLKSQQVGKSGVTHTVITALVETLEKNELLKLKIHGNCPAELVDAVRQVEMGTGSVAVSQIGRTVILYRPSVTKLQAEQKKKEARRKLMKKNSIWIRSSPKSKEEIPKLSARGRRGSSRV